MRCAACPRQAVQMHHLIPQGVLKREGRSDVLTDERNLIPLCLRCHERHHTWACRLTRDKVPAETFEFARSLGEKFVVRLEQDYPERHLR